MEPRKFESIFDLPFFPLPGGFILPCTGLVTTLQGWTGHIRPGPCNTDGGNCEIIFCHCHCHCHRRRRLGSAGCLLQNRGFAHQHLMVRRSTPLFCSSSPVSAVCELNSIVSCISQLLVLHSYRIPSPAPHSLSFISQGKGGTSRRGGGPGRGGGGGKRRLASPRTFLRQGSPVDMELNNAGCAISSHQTFSQYYPPSGFRIWISMTIVMASLTRSSFGQRKQKKKRCLSRIRVLENRRDHRNGLGEVHFVQRDTGAVIGPALQVLLG